MIYSQCTCRCRPSLGPPPPRHLLQRRPQLRPRSSGSYPRPPRRCRLQNRNETRYYRRGVIGGRRPATKPGGHATTAVGWVLRSRSARIAAPHLATGPSRHTTPRHTVRYAYDGIESSPRTVATGKAQGGRSLQPYCTLDPPDPPNIRVVGLEFLLRERVFSLNNRTLSEYRILLKKKNIASGRTKRRVNRTGVRAVQLETCRPITKRCTRDKTRHGKARHNTRAPPGPRSLRRKGTSPGPPTSCSFL